MNLYDKLLNNEQYIQTVKKIEQIKFITNGKWERIIELGMTCALLHDIGLSKGDKKDHAMESSKMFSKYIDKSDISFKEMKTIRQAILDHSKGNDIQSLIGLALVLADKLDVTYHRTINSSIQDWVNKEFQKIKEVDIIIDDKNLIVKYLTESNFDVSVLKNWNKAITIPKKVANYLNRNYIFLINNKEIQYSSLIS